MIRGALWAIGIVLLLTACVGRGVEPRSKKPEILMIPAGTQIPALGLAFDIGYDRQTDGLIPGYRILTVGITNNSLQIVPLDPIVDRWWVVDRGGRKHVAILSLRRTDPDAWAALPVGLKKLIEHPLMVPIGTTQSVDLLFRDSVKLNEFREVIFQSTGLNRQIKIYARDS